MSRAVRRSLLAAASRPQGSASEGFLYWSDDGDLMALRVRDWKMNFMIQEHHGIEV